MSAGTEKAPEDIVKIRKMARRRSAGGYHRWRDFLRCPDCGRDDVDLDHYADGTMFRCQQCGAEAWAENIGKTDE